MNPVLFWKNKSPFSNWYKCNFEVPIDGCGGLVRFNCIEQYMMFGKALLFGDFDTANKILMAKNPSEQKALGRTVKNYQDEVWASLRLEIVADGIFHKFDQNPDIAQVLLGTGDRIIAEASPIDPIWGIGLSEDDPLALDSKNWKGQNLLGEALMIARDRLRKKLNAP